MMKEFTDIEEIRGIEQTVIALGNFDGVHKGHQELIHRAVKSAEAAGIKSAVFTFSNHPKTLTRGVGVVKNILYADEKKRIVEELGIDYMFNMPFTEDILHINPVEYIEEILLHKCRMKEAYCGFNFRFGYKARGDVKTLMAESCNHGFGIHVMESYEIDGLVVSSTRIRAFIEEGDMDKCSKLLGRYYAIGGEVVVGNRLGKTLGFPTSNLVIDESMVTPSNGVYVTYCTHNGARYPSITNVGVKPTVGCFTKNVETHIFDFNNELYGKNIRVEFLKKMRSEKKFGTVEALSKQITDDCIMAKAYHRQLDKSKV